MISIDVQVGQETITASADDAKEVMKTVQILRDMARQISKDAAIRVRTNDDEGLDFFEFYSPGLRAAKKISENLKKNATVSDFPFFVGYATPWVRFKYEDGESQMFVMYDNLDDKAIENGFKEPLAWYPAKNDKKKGHVCTGEAVAFMGYSSKTDTGYYTADNDKGHEIRQLQLERKKTA